jgi:hypothetical protein
MIGAILSTIASEDLTHTVFNLTSPRDFEASWNPHEPKRFYWIDDAFGSNVLRDEYVQDWASIFRKVHAAIASGNRFVLTSRRHIYEAAKVRLGQRNLPVFSDGKAVVDVGDLSIEERRQILYNHIAFGSQTASWKRSVKPHLEAVAQVSGFLPGIAERLGNPAFTKSLRPTETELVRFMKEPREHLVDTINALDDALRAALILIYVHQGALREDSTDVAATEAVSDLTGVSASRMRACLDELRGSFLKVASVGGRHVWGFAHPTIADALTSILKERPHMIVALLRGASVETIISGFVCEGASYVPDAPLIPSTLDGILIARLAHVPDEESLNSKFFRFLADKANDTVFRRVIEADPSVLKREVWPTYKTSTDSKIAVHARTLRAGLLDESIRESTAERLEQAVATDFDFSFLDHNDILNLIPPQRLIALGIRIRTETLPDAPRRIADLAEEADTDDDSDSVFERYSQALDLLKYYPGLNDSTAQLLRKIRLAVDDAVQRFSDRQEENEKPDRSAEWTYMASTRKSESTPQSTAHGVRSVFADVDQ